MLDNLQSDGPRESNTQRLVHLVSSFRAAIDLAKQEEPPAIAGLEVFPFNWCDSVSQWLLIFLDSHGYHQIARVRGELPMESGEGKTEPQRHYWLEIGGVIADITADQFGQQPVIVSDVSSWHASLRELSRQPPWTPYRDRSHYIEEQQARAEMCRLQCGKTGYEIVCDYLCGDARPASLATRRQHLADR